MVLNATQTILHESWFLAKVLVEDDKPSGWTCTYGGNAQMLWGYSMPRN